MAIDPTLLNPTESANVPFETFTATYDDAIRNATSQLTAAQSRYLSAQSRLQAVPAGILHDDDRKAADAELAKSATVVEQASAALTRSHELKGAAIERYSQRANVPQELKDRYSAMAKTETANALLKQAEVNEFLSTSPDRRRQMALATQKARADVEVAQATADVATATTGIQKQEAQTRLDAANQAVKNAAAQEAATRAGTRLTGAQATTAEAGARLAPEQAQATLTKAQADANAANVAYLDAKRRYDATTDEQVKQAVGIELQQKQTALDTANQQLEQAKKLMPGVVAQQGATLASTQATTAETLANTQKGLLGTLYGLQDKAKEIANAIRSGGIPDVDKGMALLNDYITTTIQGTTPFERDKFATEQETSRRGQDYNLAASQGSTFGSGFSSALSTFGNLNKDIAPGSDAGGRGFIASMNMLGDRIKSFQPVASSPLLDSMRPAAAATPAVSTPASDNGHVITINIGSGAASNPQAQTQTPALLAPGAAGTSADANVAGGAQNPAFLAANRPATPSDVQAMWADHPDLQSAGWGPAGR
jgi:hypothetical protein